jgi:hypothetical protein
METPRSTSTADEAFPGDPSLARDTGDENAGTVFPSQSQKVTLNEPRDQGERMSRVRTLFGRRYPHRPPGSMGFRHGHGGTTEDR